MTPVDLHSYTAFQAHGEDRGARGGGGSRLSVSRRPVLEMPAAPRRRRRRPTRRMETLSPGAEFEPVSPLDVPAFLRRQQEG